MSTIFRGTTLDGSAKRELAVWESGGGIIVSITDELDEGPPHILSIRLDLDMADGLAISTRHRVLDCRMELEATELSTHRTAPVAHVDAAGSFDVDTHAEVHSPESALKIDSTASGVARTDEEWELHNLEAACEDLDDAWSAVLRAMARDTRHVPYQYSLAIREVRRALDTVRTMATERGKGKP